MHSACAFSACPERSSAGIRRSSSLETLQYALITGLRMYTSNDFALCLTSSARRTSLKRNQMKGKTYFTRMHSHGQLLFKSKLKSKLQCDPCSLTAAGRLFSWLDASWRFWIPFDVLEEIRNRNYKVEGKQSEKVQTRQSISGALTERFSKLVL